MKGWDVKSGVEESVVVFGRREKGRRRGSANEISEFFRAGQGFSELCDCRQLNRLSWIEDGGMFCGELTGRMGAKCF